MLNLNVKLYRAENLDKVYHGTKATALGRIIAQGILPYNRIFVHLSKDYIKAIKKADEKPGQSVLLTIDAKAMLDEGYDIYFSDEGDIVAQEIPWEFVKVVEIMNE